MLVKNTHETFNKDLKNKIFSLEVPMLRLLFGDGQGSCLFDRLLCSQIGPPVKLWHADVAQYLAKAICVP